MKTIFYLFFIAVSLLPISTFAQADSLDLDAAIDSFFKYKRTDPAIALEYITLSDSLYATETHDSDSLLIAISFYKASTHFVVGNFGMAKTIATPLKAKMKEYYPKRYPQYLLTLGTTLFRLDDIEGGKKYYHECIDWFESQNLELGYFYDAAISSLGVAYMELNDYAKAEEFLLKAYQREKDRGEAPTVASNNLGYFYMGIGDFEKAEELFLKVVQYFENPPEKYAGLKNHMTYQSLVNLSSVYDATNQDEKAVETDKKVLELVRIDKGTQHPDYSKALNNLAVSLSKVKKQSEARKYQLEGLKLVDNRFGKFHKDYTIALNNLGLNYQRSGMIDSAFYYINEAIRLERTFLNPESEYFLVHLRNISSLYVMKGNLLMGLKTDQEATNHMINNLNLVFPILSEASQEKYFSNIKRKFYPLQTLARRMHITHPEAVAYQYDIQLLIKSILLDASSKIQDQIYKSQDSMTISLFEQLKEKRNNYASLYRVPDSVLKVKKIDLQALNEEIENLEAQINRRTDLYQQLVQKKEVSWKQVQANLKEREAAIEIVKYPLFAFNKDGGYTDTVLYAALLVKKDSKFPTYIEIGDGALLDKEGYYSYKRDIRERILESDAYDIFWRPIKEHLSGIDKVYFSPDGVYHSINMNSLYNKEDQSYIVDEISFVQVASTREITKTRDNQSKPNTALLIGAPHFNEEKIATINIQPTDTIGKPLSRGTKLEALPGAKKEIEELERLFTKFDYQSTSFLGEKASEIPLKATKNMKLVHIATHGFFQKSKKDQQEPPLMQSGLYFSGAQQTLDDSSFQDLGLNSGEDGIFTALEAKNLDLKGTELVTLSACDSGLGTVRSGEGVYGLQRAFKIAGAESILMSLWKVDDEVTKKLMVEFYTQWLSGKSKSSALKLAQQKIRNDHPHPFFWAPFILIGQ